LARHYGTPLGVIDLGAVDAAIASLQAACAPKAVEISYAAKAFFCVAFARHLAKHAIGLDVCSMGELVTAERGGFDAARITLHGSGKTAEELEAAAVGRVGCIAVDGIDELRALAQIARRQRRGVEVLLRLNTGIAAHTHAFVRTGGDDTKFGIAPADESAAAAIVGESEHLRLAGVHAHVGSQIYESEPFAANAEALVDAAGRLARAGLSTPRIVVGGGFGVRMRPGADDESLDPAVTIAAIAERTRARADALGLVQPRIAIEPGRAIVAQAGITLYRVLAVKHQSNRTFVVVDGGMFENPRPALYGAYHHVTPIAQRGGPVRAMTLCGRSCENDELGDVRLSENTQPGDLLAMETTGAYTFSMAGNYNRFPRPAVVAVENGTPQLFVRRETVDDVLGRDV